MKNYQGHLIFAPSETELRSYSGKDTYWGGLSETIESIDNLLDSLHADWNSPQPDDPHHSSPRLEKNAPDSHGASPDLLIELGMYLSSAGVGAGVYKLLTLWVKNKNGRKLRVRFPSGFEVEATQLSKDEFSEVVKTLAKTDEGELSPEEAKIFLEGHGYTVLKDVDAFEERRSLKSAFQEGINRNGDRN